MAEIVRKISKLIKMQRKTIVPNFLGDQTPLNNLKKRERKGKWKLGGLFSFVSFLRLQMNFVKKQNFFKTIVISEYEVLDYQKSI